MDHKSRFPIRFDRIYGFLSTALFVSPAASYVEIDGDEVRARMAWSFRARFPRSTVVAVSEYRQRTISRGVHGLAGRWLVNGSAAGVVSIVLEPTQRAYVLGFPVRLRNLLVSVEDPAGLMDALGAEPAVPDR